MVMLLSPEDYDMFENERQEEDDDEPDTRPDRGAACEQKQHRRQLVQGIGVYASVSEKHTSILETAAGITFCSTIPAALVNVKIQGR
jgi:hypothetical protein